MKAPPSICSCIAPTVNIFFWPSNDASNVSFTSKLFLIAKRASTMIWLSLSNLLNSTLVGSLKTPPYSEPMTIILSLKALISQDRTGLAPSM